MKSSHQLSSRFRAVFLNGKWVANTNYKDLLESITWEQATKKISTLNTIALLTFHVNYYLEGVLNVLEGGRLEIRDKFSFDASEIKSKADWEALVNVLLVNSEKFAQHIEKMSDEKLDQTFVDEKYGNYDRNMNGMIEHAYYHLGQISLLKKMIA